MVVKIVSISFPEDAKLFEAFVDSLVPWSCPFLRLFFFKRLIINGNSYFSRFSAVSSVRFYHFPLIQFMDKFWPEDGDIGPCTARKGSVRVNDITTVYRISNLISKSRTLELMRIPSRWKGRRFQDHKVSSVNGHPTPCVPRIDNQSVLELNLKIKATKNNDRIRR